MEIITQAFITGIISIILLFLLTKLTGNKQISQMSMFDYIAGITVGSSAAEMAIGGEAFLPAAVVTALYGVAAFLISFTCNKSVKARRYLNGEPILLYRNGIFYKKNMAKARMDMGEFMTQCRTNGTFTLKDISCVIMEANGKVSIMKKQLGELREPAITVMVDGRILKNNLEASGKSEWWLISALDKKGIKANEVMLAMIEKNELFVYPFSEEEKMTGCDIQ